MGRNSYTKKILMLLCFGMAFLSLAVHWHSHKSMQQMMSPSSQSGEKNQAKKSSPPSPKNSKSPANSQQKQSWWPQFLRVEQPSHATSQQVTNQPVQTLSKPIKLNPNSQNSANTNNSPLLSKVTHPNHNQVAKTKVIVDLSDRRVYVYKDEKVIASYPTGIGKRGWDTPIGSFQVMHMEHDPIWKHPITGKVYPAGKPDSPLGARWIGFYSTNDGEIGFHGTPDEELVGTEVSHGCLRMRNADVKMLYAQVNLGTPVQVRQ